MVHNTSVYQPYVLFEQGLKGLFADENKDTDTSVTWALLASDVRVTENTSSAVSESLKNICTILGHLSNQLTCLEKGPNGKTSAETARGSEKPTGTDATRGGHNNLDSDRGKQGTNSDNESDFCVEVGDADEATYNPDILTLLEEDLEVREKFGPAVSKKLRTISRGQFTVWLPEPKLKNKLT